MYKRKNPQTFCQIQKIRLDSFFNPEKEDMSGKNQTYGNPTPDIYKISFKYRDMVALIKWFVTSERLSCSEPSPYIPMRYAWSAYKQNGFSSAFWFTFVKVLNGLSEELGSFVEKCQQAVWLPSTCRYWDEILRLF